MEISKGLAPHFSEQKVTDPETGVVVRLERRVYGALHSLNDEPAVVERNRLTGVAVYTAYCSLGQTHRNPKKGPALIERDPVTGIVTWEDYRTEQERHRDPEDGPALIERDPQSGRITRTLYC